ncbi:hypothetical protein [Actinosynnema sp. NPDC020468]|uniref:WXG100 family type VII secretion target n=1 Tax=Actinosynnema sp. NPDC020468 TaxID=3154488 RepID=UPI0033EAA23E
MRRDGREIAASVGDSLDYLTGISRRLGVRDLVAEYFAPVLGQWEELHAEAERWRRAGVVAEHVARDLTAPLGRVDSAWQGRDADAFVAHMQQVGLAGQDTSDALLAMADALDLTASAVRDVVEDMARVFSDAADTVSEAAALPLDGDRRVVEALEDLHKPARDLHDSVRDVLEAFARLCDELADEPPTTHAYPARNWSPAPSTTSAAAVNPARRPEIATGTPDPTAAASPAPAASATGSTGSGPTGSAAPGSGSTGSGSIGSGSTGSGSTGSVSGSAPAAAGGVPAEQNPLQQGGSTAVAEPKPGEPAQGRPAAAAAAPGGAAAAGMGGGGIMGGMGAGAGGQQGGDKEHKSKVRLASSPEALLGAPKKTAPPTLGED